MITDTTQNALSDLLLALGDGVQAQCLLHYPDGGVLYMVAGIGVVLETNGTFSIGGLRRMDAPQAASVILASVCMEGIPF